jgi:ferrochelatase
MNYDALLIVSFGGPESRDDVIPFLENVLRGRNVPRERMLAVAEHYYHFEGKSPINQQTRKLIVAIEKELAERGPKLPVYWGNRNWHPMLADTVRQMQRDGVRRALALATSAYGGYSGCRQYLEDIAEARQAVGSGAPAIDKIPPFSGHPLFIEANADRLREALRGMEAARVVFTAHSIPMSMAATSRYEEQIRCAAAAVAHRVGRAEWDVAWQSRSGPPQQPWLGPDILDHLRALGAAGTREVVVSPIGFLSDHMEVLYDLDVEAAALARHLGMKLVRAGSGGMHPAIVRMFRELVMDRLQTGEAGCVEDCCPAPARGGR